ncbi:MAG: ankyrin repeat domain-containing protein, partial [Hyphomonadaceae bacterium]|nr:ankyrin repeat domain-containing protein [Hyphomonadaceae bacterium]
QDGWTPLLVAAAHGTADTIAALIESGADMEVRTGEGWTPLHLAAGFGAAETVTAAPSSPATGTCTNASIPCIFMGGDPGLLTMSISA